MLDRDYAKVLEKLALDNSVKTKADEKKFVDLQEQFQDVKQDNDLNIRNI